ncbi:QcrA and Rieske domain-containing protein [Calditrichota bacterium GD2]
MNGNEFKTTRRNALKIISSAIVALTALLTANFIAFFRKRKRLVAVPLPAADQPLLIKRDFFVRQREGRLQVFSRTCPHLGCKVQFVKERNLFICPCHGSQFTLDGQFVKGPAGRDLFKVDFEQTQDQLIVKV